VAEGEAPSTNVPVVVKGFDAVNETLTVDNGGQPQQMALHQAVVMTYKGPSPAQLAAVSAAAAPSTSVGGPTGGMPQNLTPEQVEAFRQQMRDRFSKGRGPDGATDGRTRGDATTTGKTPKNAAPVAPTTTKPPKTPKVR
jgi:hypothetical protein